MEHPQADRPDAEEVQEREVEELLELKWTGADGQSHVVDEVQRANDDDMDDLPEDAVRLKRLRDGGTWWLPKDMFESLYFRTAAPEG